MERMIRFSFMVVATLSLLAFVLAGCSSSSFMGGAGTKSKATDTGTNPDGTGTSGTGNTGVNSGNVNGGAGGNVGAGTPVVPGSSTSDVPVPVPLKEKIGGLSDEQFNNSMLVKNFSTSVQDSFYIVTMNGKAYYYTMEGATAPDINDVKIISKKMWTFPIAGSGGNRTYVTEGGLVFVRSGGRVFWIDPLKTPEGPLDMTPGGPNYFQIAGVPDDHRGCPVSYKVGEKRYVGVGYSSGLFGIFNQDDVPPYKPNWTTLDAKYKVTTVDATWGYSCYIDQTRLIYYGQWCFGSPSGFDLTAKQQVTPTQSAPNGSLIFMGGASNGSYGMGGDRDGNVFNLGGGGGGLSDANTHYTFAADAGKTATWSSRFPGMMYVYPVSCLTKGTSCDAPYAYDTVAQLGYAIGPMSALPSTGVIASERSGSDVFFMRLKDPAKLASGIEAKHLDKVDGSVYMYDDFTGATLYGDNSLVSYNLGDAASFDKNTALAVLIISWEANDGQPTTWQDLELDIRCYKDGDFPPNFAPVVGMNDAGMRTFVQVGSCRNTAANKVDMQVKQLNNASTIGRIKDFKVNFYQGN